MVHLQARAWLSNGMALSRLSAMASTGVLGERLGDNLFLPASLRHLWQMAA